MKKIIAIVVLGLFFNSCDTTPEESYTLEVVPVAKVQMQTKYALDSITQIPIKYVRPTNCHFFEDFYYEKSDYTRNVAIYCAKLNGNNNCVADLTDTITIPLRFKPETLGTYHFKFWIGTNADGIDQFIEHNAVVNH